MRDSVILTTSNYGQTTSVRAGDSPSTPTLSNKVANFDLTDATLIDALSKLSNEPIAGLHLGIEEIIQDKFSEPTDRSVRFSLSLVLLNGFRLVAAGILIGLFASDGLSRFLASQIPVFQPRMQEHSPPE
jgi:hypothetical protein